VDSSEKRHKEAKESVKRMGDSFEKRLREMVMGVSNSILNDNNRVMDRIQSTIKRK